jgi:hypothetical protein
MWAVKSMRMFYNNTTLFCKKHLQKPEESSTDATLSARAKQLCHRQFCKIKTNELSWQALGICNDIRSQQA